MSHLKWQHKKPTTTKKPPIMNANEWSEDKKKHYSQNIHTQLDIQRNY